LHRVTEALETNQYVVVLALDFSKAFDTVRHCSLMEKVAQLDLPDNGLPIFSMDTVTARGSMATRHIC